MCLLQTELHKERENVNRIVAEARLDEHRIGVVRVSRSSAHSVVDSYAGR